MTIKYFTFSSTGAGTQWLVTSDNGVYVAENTTVGSTDDYGLTGTGSHTSFDIDGTVYGDLGGISITTADNAYVRVSEHAQISSDLDDGVAFNLSDVSGTIENRGEIRGDKGFEIAGNSDITLSNFGDIITKAECIHTDAAATGQYELLNYGRMESWSGSSSAGVIKSEGKTNDVIINLGAINGSISLGGGADVYFGSGEKAMDGGFGLLLTVLGQTKEKIGSIVDAGGGNDQLMGGKYVDYFLGNTGNDSISGGGGDDVLVGGAGGDTLTGGTGEDHFEFTSLGDSHGKKIDIIEDFNHKQHDGIDLAFDAKPGTTDIDAFKFIGTHHFSGKPGELRYEFHNGDTIVLGNTDHDAKAEFELHLHGEINLVKADFGLGT